MRLIDADALKIALDTFATLVGFGGLYDRGQVMECIDAARTVGGWVSVKDRKPEASCIYLTWCTYHDIKRGFYRLSEYCAENGGWYDWISRDYGESYVKYWMPLPEPPKEVSEDD